MPKLGSRPTAIPSSAGASGGRPDDVEPETLRPRAGAELDLDLFTAHDAQAEQDLAVLASDVAPQGVGAGLDVRKPEQASGVRARNRGALDAVPGAVEVHERVRRRPAGSIQESSADRAGRRELDPTAVRDVHARG
jgi:hypothetical protein